MALARYWERHNVAGANSDGGDAKVLADRAGHRSGPGLLRTDRQIHRPILVRTQSAPYPARGEPDQRDLHSQEARSSAFAAVEIQHRARPMRSIRASSQRMRPPALRSSSTRSRFLRLGGAVGALALMASSARHDGVSKQEASLFRLLNDLPDQKVLGVWPVMQFGALGAVPVVAAIVRLDGDRALARRILVSGTLSWALSKAIKLAVQRPRPSALLSATRERGRPAAGLGFVSGHAAVATALALRLWRRESITVDCALALVTAVGGARLYVGAHLPLDVLGGVALGLAVDAAVDLAAGAAERQPRHCD